MNLWLVLVQGVKIMNVNVLVKESCSRPIQTQRHITKVAYVDLAARKLNLLNFQLYICIYIYIHIHTYIHTYIRISFTLPPLDYGICSACKSGISPPYFPHPSPLALCILLRYHLLLGFVFSSMHRTKGIAQISIWFRYVIQMHTRIFWLYPLSSPYLQRFFCSVCTHTTYRSEGMLFIISQIKYFCC